LIGLQFSDCRVCDPETGTQNIELNQNFFSSRGHVDLVRQAWNVLIFIIGPALRFLGRSGAV